MNCELMLTYDTPAYMFNVYKNQPSRQTGSRNVTGTKTLPTIWDGRKDRQTEWQTEVKQYTNLQWSGGIINVYDNFILSIVYLKFFLI